MERKRRPDLLGLAGEKPEDDCERRDLEERASQLMQYPMVVSVYHSFFDNF